MKNMFGLTALTLSLVMLSSCAVEKTPLEEDLQRLDDALGMMDEYVRAKNQSIKVLEDVLATEEMSLLQQYHVYGQLYDEYEAFQFDKAKEVLEIQEKLADEMNDRSLKNSATIEKAYLFTVAGMFLEAETVFNQLDTTLLDHLQKMCWLNARQKFIHDYQDYVKTAGIMLPDAHLEKKYQDRILNETQRRSPLNAHIRVRRLIDEEKYEEAYGENQSIIESLNKDTRDYAVQTYWQGYICENLDREEETVKWWVESAICDIRCAIKDNASLSSIAIKLINPEDAERAFKYIRLSLNDAIFYNAKLRKVQIASTLPWIEKAYSDSKELQNKERNTYLLIASLSAVLLLLTSILLLRMYHNRKVASDELETKNMQLAAYADSIKNVEDDLRKSNLDLVEANAAKEEYLALFLSMCSGYLDKLRKTIQMEQYESELKNFYKIFDTSFLHLYPSFVEDFNALLKEDGRIVLKEGEMLNTELRVFALIRLGITQSSHIASLLRYSVNTIYNYRAQIKNAALSDRENFEDSVRKIGSRKS